MKHHGGKKWKRGFTLIELGISMGVVGSLALVSAQESQFETSQNNARAMGNEIFQHNSAVSRYLVAHAGDPAAVGVTETTPQTHIGASWLKDSSCAGSADQAYFSCDLMVDGRTIQYRSQPTTTISLNTDGALTARTLWSPVTGTSGKDDAMIMGVAAMVASGNYISQIADGAAGYQLPTVYCPDLSSYSASISSICEPPSQPNGRNQIVSMANTNSTLEPWLRTDHGNTMLGVIEFGGIRSTPGEIDSVDDGGAVGGWAGSGMRQIVNVARLYNGRDGDQDSVVIGRQHGKSLFSNGFVTSNGLLNNAAIIDGDAGVMEDLRVRLNAFVENNVSAGNDVLATRHVRATNGNVTANNGTVQGAYVRSLGDMQADGYAYAQRYVDLNNTTKYMDPSSRSQVNAITATGDIRATRFYDQNNAGYYVDPASTSRMNVVDANRLYSRGEVRADGEVKGTLFRDLNNTSRVVNPSARSEINSLTVNNTGTSALVSAGRIRANEYLQLNRSVTPGTNCWTNGLQARKSNGAIVSCVSGKWTEAGIPQFKRYLSLPASGTAPSSGVMTVRSCHNCSLTCKVGGKTIFSVSDRDKYGTGKTSSAMGIGKGMSYSCSGSDLRMLATFD